MAATTGTELADAWSETLRRRRVRLLCHGSASSRLAHGLGVSEFEVLEWLAVQGKESCRMQELSEGVHLSQSALSRLVGRLEADGLGAPQALPGGPPRDLRVHHRRGPCPL